MPQTDASQPPRIPPILAKQARSGNLGNRASRAITTAATLEQNRQSMMVPMPNTTGFLPKEKTASSGKLYSAASAPALWPPLVQAMILMR